MSQLANHYLFFYYRNEIKNGRKNKKMKMKLKTEDDNNLEQYLVEIAGELDAILKGKLSSCQLMKFSLFKRR